MFRVGFIILCFLFPLSAEVFEGYTLFTPGQGSGATTTTYLKSNDLSNFNIWTHENSAASMPYLIPGNEPGWENTLLIYPYRVNNPTMESGGVGGGVQCLTWNGAVIWSHIISNSNYHFQMGMS